MSPQAAAMLRASPRMTSLMARRAFHATRARLSSPYHYPEGPYTNIPFNPRTRFFAFRFWGFCATGFFLPFGIAVWQTYKPKP
ncbi:cytochrome-c oxidase chain VIIc [Nemania sp. FL0916]|nr:cytochrome-c oxidase chain VIIc [Nemania sp. FL0916]